jgi:hypothetical protein
LGVRRGRHVNPPKRCATGVVSSFQWPSISFHILEYYSDIRYL